MNQKLTLAWRPSLAEPRGRGFTLYYQFMAADVVSMLSGFETYDALAQAERDQQAIVRTLIRMTRAVGDSA